MPSQYCSLLKVFPVQSSPADRHGNAQQSSHLLHSNVHSAMDRRWSQYVTSTTYGWRWASVMQNSKGNLEGRILWCCPLSHLQEGAGQEKKQLFKSEADTKTPSNAGCLIQSWMLHLALRRKHESPGLAGCNSGTHQGRAMPGDSHLQDLPSTAKITVLFLSGRHKLCEVRAMF